MELDLSSLNSVRQFAAKVNKQESRLDVLVNNAGVANTFGKKVTEDGLELTMATNQYGPFLLTHLLLRKNTCHINYYHSSYIYNIFVLRNALYNNDIIY